MNSDLQVKTVKSEGIVILAYGILIVLFASPAIFKLNGMLMGDGTHGLDWSWNFWWFKRAVFEKSIHLFHTDLLFWPRGADLYFNEFSLANCILYLPLSFFMNTVTAYNLLQLFTFLIAAYGAYRLAFYFCGDKAAAFFSGMVYSFSAFHLFSSYFHMNISSIQWFPWMLLYFIKMLREDRSRNAILAAVFFLLNALSCWYYMVFSFLILPLLWLFLLRENGKAIFSGGKIRRQLIFLALSLIGLAPFLGPILFAYHPGGYMVQSDASLWYSAEPASYVLPGYFSCVGRALLRPFYDRLDFTANQCMNLGFFAILLALLAVRRRKEPMVRFWFYSGIIFFILSLGPYLRIFGKWYITWTDWRLLTVVSDFLREKTGGIGGFDFHRYALPLPEMLVSRIPFLNIMRVPSRYALLVVLSTSVLSGIGLNYLRQVYFIKKSFPPFYYPAAVACLCAFFFLEQWTFPFPSLDYSVPEVYRTVAADPEDDAIFEMPSEDWDTQARYVHYQTFHHKKIARGVMSRESKENYGFLDGNPVARILRGMEPIENAVPDSAAIREMKAVKYKYIIVHWKWLKELQKKPDALSLRKYLETCFGPGRDIGESTLYRLY